MTNNIVKKSFFFKATPDVVWSFLTQKDKLAQWLHPAKADFELGKDFTLLSKMVDGEQSEICWGKVLEMDEPSLLKFTFTIKPLNGVITTVTWELAEANGGTNLSLTHEGIAGGDDVATLGILTALDGGWDGHVVRLRQAMA